MRETLREIYSEMEEFYDSRSEKWHESEKAETYQSDMSFIDDAANSLENISEEN